MQPVDARVAVSRVQRRVGRIVLVNASVSALVVSLALITMGDLGVVGVGTGYLTGQLVVAAAVLPSLLRLLRTASRETVHRG